MDIFKLIELLPDSVEKCTFVTEVNHSWSNFFLDMLWGKLKLKTVTNLMGKGQKEDREINMWLILPYK